MVLKDIKIKTELYGAKYTYVFAKTISLGRINLYQVPIQTFLGGTHLTTVDIYILEKNGQQELSQVPNRMSKMRDLINKLTADEPKELDFETNKKIYHEDIPHLIKNYNIRFR
ncbi:hypothetical protein [Labilibacter marinus]|uniref:hypothetical protein n=1 Tax=Labilibacter marinus TaxID=1477105 RepID=UPI00094F58D8|nr:hypothetical protein [Labilibacter marinus]